MPSSPRTRTYGISEWYGHSFVKLDRQGRTELAAKALQHLGETSRTRQDQRVNMPCPFKGGICNKKGGICSLRPYEATGDGGAAPRGDNFVTVCPNRFLEGNTIFNSIAGTVLRSPDFKVIGQIPFLKRQSSAAADDDAEGVGRIDNIVVRVPAPPNEALHWCAVELQAVYFSGEKMEHMFRHVGGLGPGSYSADGIPYPDRRRGPDWRSSGVKRLMPQLQIKVPEIVRWGKRLVVVTDRAWYQNNVGDAQTVSDISNCDVVWLIVDYVEERDAIRLHIDQTRFLKLNDTVIALTGGRPTTQAEFEAKIRQRADL